MRVDEAKGAVSIPMDGIALRGNLLIPTDASGLVVFAHGSGSSRLSPRNRLVAERLRQRGLGTLLFDLLTAEEERQDQIDDQLRFDIPFLGRRLVAATDWLRRQPSTHALPIGYFGASTGAGAALMAAADRPREVGAVVSRGGRPDLAADVLGQVQAPTLLIVGGADTVVLGLNRSALRRIQAPKQLAVVPGAGHLFEEPGALEGVANLAADWFVRYLHPQVGEPAEAKI